MDALQPLTGSDDSFLVNEPSVTPLRAPRPFPHGGQALTSYSPNRLNVTDSRDDSFAVSRADSHDPYAGVHEALITHDSHAALPRIPPDVETQSVKGGYRRRLLLVVASALLIILAVVLGVYFGVVRPHSKANRSAATGPSSSHSTPPGSPTAAAIVIGRDGTEVTTEQGTTFTYRNPFGGYFVRDSSNPFNNDARAQDYTPPLNTTWDWGRDQALGVNLGGWLVLEPFITPTLYQKYPTAIDEWTLSVAMAADTSPGGGIGQLEEHYRTFITEEDFAQIAGAGLNWIRLPVPYWAIDVWPGEPFLPRTCWKYILKAFDWSRKYGLRIFLDLHTAPGSQSGYNHSGQLGQTNLLNGVMGIANAQRLLHYIRIFTEFISQPQYRDLIVMFGLVNEPTGMPWDSLFNFYLEAYTMIRNITGVGEGHGPYISVQSVPGLTTFTGADRISVDIHPYFAFDGSGALDAAPYGATACTSLNPTFVGSSSTFGVTTAGEWSVGFNDCGLMFNSADDRHSTPNCTMWDEWEQYTPRMKADLLNFAMSSMDALHHWFFWTWKVGPSNTTSSPRAPLWSYKLGLDNGWIPTNPREANGHCSRAGIAQQTFDGTYLPYQTGGPGAGTVSAAVVASYGAWPPTSIGGVAPVSLLPTYTPTGPVPTLPTQTYASPTYTLPPGFDGGDGWFNDQDSAGGMTTVAGCTYPNAWDAIAAAVPTALCTGT